MKEDEDFILPEFIEELFFTDEPIDEIRIDTEGRWFHNGIPFTNKKIIDFFNRSIRLTSDGVYVIHYDHYTYPIVVEDVPIFITGVRYQGFGDFERVWCNLTTGIEEELDTSTLRFNMNNNALYCRVMDGVFPAKFYRSASFTLLERLDEKNGRYYLNICGKSIELKQVR